MRNEEENKPGFFAKNKIKLILAGVFIIAFGVYFLGAPKSSPKKKSSGPVMISLPPTPPPPPPPPPPPKEQPPEPETPKEEEFTPEEAPEPEPQAAPEPAPMGTNIEGNGPDAFGLAKGGGSGMVGGSGTGKGGKGSKFGGYASQVQGSVVQALRNHRKTKSASLNVTARIWLDSSGRVTRSTLSGSSGNPATDTALRNEILTGLQMQPPPEGMPMPIVMRLKATRPN